MQRRRGRVFVAGPLVSLPPICWRCFCLRHNYIHSHQVLVLLYRNWNSACIWHSVTVPPHHSKNSLCAVLYWLALFEMRALQQVWILCPSACLPRRAIPCNLIWRPTKRFSKLCNWPARQIGMLGLWTLRVLCTQKPHLRLRLRSLIFSICPVLPTVWSRSAHH